jgi:CRISPR/Cas system-associated exonuclease Cas4 (RecB family)
VTLPPWSFSSIKAYEQCPRKFYHLKVIKDYEESSTEATLYGSQFHEAAEFYIRDGTPLPPQFNYAKSVLDNFSRMPGEKLCEYEMGLTEDLQPCGFKAENVWWRGIADLIILDRENAEARVVDYKTGKSTKYADKGQLELMALAIFKHFPEIKKVKGGLLFVVANAFLKDNYHVDQQDVRWGKWIADRKRMAASYANDVWNARPSGLCRNHCVVLSCPHNGRN